MFLGYSSYVTSHSYSTDINTFPVSLKMKFGVLFAFWYCLITFSVFSVITFLIVELFLANCKHSDSLSFICKNETMGRLSGNSGMMGMVDCQFFLLGK